MLFCQWARDQFEGFFSQQVQVADDYLTDPHKCLQHIRNLRGYEKVRMIVSLPQIYMCFVFFPIRPKLFCFQSAVHGIILSLISTY